MIPITVIGVDRPALAAVLAARGMRIVDRKEGAAAMLTTLAEAGRTPRLVQVEAPAALIAALDAGADDAVLAGEGDPLVAARLAALVRRSAPATIALGDLTIDTIERRVERGRRAVPLLPREYALLLRLARAPGVTHSRASLRAAVWGLDFDPGTNVIEVHMSRLRAKLDRGTAPILLTDKGRGYRLVPADPVPASASG